MLLDIGNCKFTTTEKKDLSRKFFRQFFSFVCLARISFQCLRQKSFSGLIMNEWFKLQTQREWRGKWKQQKNVAKYFQIRDATTTIINSQKSKSKLSKY